MHLFVVDNKVLVSHFHLSYCLSSLLLIPARWYFGYACQVLSPHLDVVTVKLSEEEAGWPRQHSVCFETQLQEPAAPSNVPHKKKVWQSLKQAHAAHQKLCGVTHEAEASGGQSACQPQDETVTKFKMSQTFRTQRKVNKRVGACLLM